MKYVTYFVQDPQICAGATVVKGTRVPVRTILTSLAEGDRIEAIVRSFPTLSEGAVWAVIALASDLAADIMAAEGNARP